jgi:hypothetical protein
VTSWERTWGNPGFQKTILSGQASFSTSKGRSNPFFNGRYLARKLRSMPAFHFVRRRILP